VQVHEHVFLEMGFLVIDSYAIVVAVEAMDEGLNGGFVEVAEVGGGLPRFLAEHQELRGDEPKCVDDDFAFDGLDGVDDDCDGARGELLEGLLCVDVYAGEPAAEAGVGVVPADDNFGARWGLVGGL